MSTWFKGLRRLVLAIALLNSQTALSFDRQPSFDQSVAMLSLSDPQTNVLMAMTNMVGLAAKELRDRGYYTTADNMFSEFVTMSSATAKLGDHEPLSRWIDDWYIVIEFIVGKRTMELLHLDDIQIMNYAIPVVFDPCNEDWDEDEYLEHYVPFAGTVTYWTVFGACTAVTFGGGWWIVCQPAATASETIMIEFFAEDLGRQTYALNNCGKT